jgi:hypothetical protein
MTMTERFPDVSMKMREKLAMRQKKNSPILSAKQEKPLVDFYNNEFRIWHIKLGVIITVLLVGLYITILNLSGFFHWITT